MSDYQTDWLDEIDARVKAVTPGPWMHGVSRDPSSGHWVDTKPDLAVITVADDIPSDDDAEFIAHAPEDIARLVAEVHRYREEFARVDAVLRRAEDYNERLGMPRDSGWAWIVRKAIRGES